MKNRDMFYPGMMNPMMSGMPGTSMGMPSSTMGMPSTPGTGMPSNQFGGQGLSVAYDIERRIDGLERQVKRLETRVTRLETPYGTGQMPSGGQYATSGQLSTQPYSTSVPSQDFMSTNYPTAMHMM